MYCITSRKFYKHGLTGQEPMSTFIRSKEKELFEHLHTKKYSSSLAVCNSTPCMTSFVRETVSHEALSQGERQALYFQAEYPQSSAATSSYNDPLSIFIAHTYNDGRILLKIEQILRTIDFQEGGINYQPGEIALDTRWKESRYNHLASVDLILLLVTQSFVATEYCYSEQLKWAILRHNQEQAYIIPVLLQACLWDGTPFAGLHTITPANRKAVDEWSRPAQALHEIARDIRNAVRYIRRGR